MNAKQATKYELIKAALKATSFEWVDAPSYTRNGEVVYQSNSVFFKPSAGVVYELVVRGITFSLVRGDQHTILDMVNEYTIDEASVMTQAEKINKAAQNVK